VAYSEVVKIFTGANIFFISDNEIHTPIPDCFLDGITRRTVIEIAKDHGFKIVERSMFIDDLKDFDQCFITGTAAEVTPVCAIDDQEFFVGDEIKKISATYIDLVNNWSGD